MPPDVSVQWCLSICISLLCSQCVWSFSLLMRACMCMCMCMYVLASDHWKWLMSACGAVSAQAVSILTCEDEGSCNTPPTVPPSIPPSLPRSTIWLLSRSSPSILTHTHNCHFTDTAISQHWYPDECNEASQDSLKHTHSLTWAQAHKQMRT